MSRPADPLRSVERRPLWQAQLPAQPDRRARPLPDVVDLAVIGGGLAGCAAARRGAQLGARVVLLEAESIGWGASSRSGGMCHPGFKWGPAELMERHGAILGESIYRESVDAFEWTAETIREEGIEAAFVRSGHLQLAVAPSHLEHLATAAASLATVGEAARTIRAPELRDEIGTEAYAGALVVERSGGLDPARYVAGLAAAAERAGASLHEGVRALQVRSQADGRAVVETSAGPVVAREVFVATNGYTDGVAPALRRRVMPIGSSIIATDPLSEDLAHAISPNGRMFFDSKNFLYYWRLTPDRRMLFGGRASFWPSSVHRTARILLEGMLRVHPQLAGVRVAYAWTGKVGFTFDRMPHVGRLGGVTYATGCCGSGIAILPYLGHRAAGWILGGEPAPALASLRFPLVPAPYEGRPWFLPAVGEWYRLADWRAGRERPQD
jgi:glycine/D-amino acid oxidase-like deaminating enzyme